MPYLKVGNAQRPAIIQNNNQNVQEVWCKDSLVAPGVGNNTLIWKAQEVFDIGAPNSACGVLNLADYIAVNKQYSSTTRFVFNINASRGQIVTGDLTAFDKVTLNVAPGVLISGPAGVGSGANGGDAIVLTNGSVLDIQNQGSIYGAGGNGGAGGAGSTFSITTQKWTGGNGCYLGTEADCVPYPQTGINAPAYHPRWTSPTDWAWQSTGCGQAAYGTMNPANITWGDQTNVYYCVGHPLGFGYVKLGYSCDGYRHSYVQRDTYTMTFNSAPAGAGGSGESCVGPATPGLPGAPGSTSGAGVGGFDPTSGLNINQTNFPNYYNSSSSGSGGAGGNFGMYGAAGSPSPAGIAGQLGGAPGVAINTTNGSIAPGSVLGDVLPIQ